MRYCELYFLAWVAITVVIQNAYARMCPSGTVTQYSLLFDPVPVNGYGFLVPQVTRAACTHFCDVNRNLDGMEYACSAFGYQEDERTCYLYGDEIHEKNAISTIRPNENATASPTGNTTSPTGNATELTGNVAESIGNATGSTVDQASETGYIPTAPGPGGVVVYEKTCLAAPQTCKIVPALERSVARVLVGFTQVVVESIISKEACLDECLRSMEKHDFLCMSAMYYTESQDCMLNFDSKTSYEASEFFTNETEGYTVEYFDNLCAIRQRDRGIRFNGCPTKSSPTFLRINGTKLPQFGVVVYSNTTVEECLEKCNYAENFTCNSVTYWAVNASCTLSHIEYTSIPFSSTQAPNEVGDLGAAYYQRLCIEGAGLVCTNASISFDTLTNRRLSSEYKILSLPGLSLGECLDVCLLDPSNECRSVNYDREKSVCQLNNATRHEAPIMDADSENGSVAYYENLCHSENTTVVLETIQKGKEPDHQKVENATTPSFQVQSICEYSDMRVKVVSEDPFTGFIFAKNRFGTCRHEVKNAAEIILSLQFPNFQGTESPCGVDEIAPNVYSVVVVVTTNNMGVPGLVTDGDQFFNITCDFGNGGNTNLVTATGGTVSINNPQNSPSFYPDGIISIPSPMNMELRRVRTREAKIHTAVLGEKLHLDFFVYPGFNRTGIGLFVRQCNASRHSGPPPEPEPDPLILIDDGCPTQSAKGKIIRSPVMETPEGFTLPFTAFKFDGSNGVKITCVIDMCEKGCNPTQCIIDGQQVASYGKRRKRSSDPKQGGKRSESSVVFTVVEKFDDTDSQGTRTAEEEDSMLSMEKDKTLKQFTAAHDQTGKKPLCFKKSTFLAVSMSLAAVCFIQIVVIAAYVAQQYVTIGKKNK